MNDFPEQHWQPSNGDNAEGTASEMRMEPVVDDGVSSPGAAPSTAPEGPSAVDELIGEPAGEVGEEDADDADEIGDGGALVVIERAAAGDNVSGKQPDADPVVQEPKLAEKLAALSVPPQIAVTEPGLNEKTSPDEPSQPDLLEDEGAPVEENKKNEEGRHPISAGDDIEHRDTNDVEGEVDDDKDEDLGIGKMEPGIEDKESDDMEGDQSLEDDEGDDSDRPVLSALDQMMIRYNNAGGELTVEEADELAWKVKAGRDAAAALEDDDLFSQAMTARGLAREELGDVLTREAYEGDEAREKLVLRNMGLVAAQMRRYAGGLREDDRFRAGLRGLYAAVNGFRPELGNRFSTYAVPSIRREMRDEMHSYRYPFNVPQLKGENLAKLQDARAAFYGREARMPTRQELNGLVDLEPKQIDELLALERRLHLIVSTDLPIPDYDETVGDHIPDDEPGPADRAVTQDAYRVVTEAVSGLPEKRREAITMFLGLGDDAPMTIPEIADATDRSQEAVRVLVRKTQEYLKGNPRIKELYDDILGDSH